MLQKRLRAHSPILKLYTLTQPREKKNRPLIIATAVASLLSAKVQAAPNPHPITQNSRSRKEAKNTGEPRYSHVSIYLFLFRKKRRVARARVSVTRYIYMTNIFAEGIKSQRSRVYLPIWLHTWGSPAVVMPDNEIYSHAASYSVTLFN